MKMGDGSQENEYFFFFNSIQGLWIVFPVKDQPAKSPGGTCMASDSFWEEASSDRYKQTLCCEEKTVEKQIDSSVWTVYYYNPRESEDDKLCNFQSQMSGTHPEELKC